MDPRPGLTLKAPMTKRPCGNHETQKSVGKTRINQPIIWEYYGNIGNGNVYTRYKHGDDWRMVYEMVCFTMF
jgi:hypothetical protein